MAQSPPRLAAEQNSAELPSAEPSAAETDPIACASRDRTDAAPLRTRPQGAAGTDAHELTAGAAEFRRINATAESLPEVLHRSAEVLSNCCSDILVVLLAETEVGAGRTVPNARATDHRRVRSLGRSEAHGNAIGGELAAVAASCGHAAARSAKIRSAKHVDLDLSGPEVLHVIAAPLSDAIGEIAVVSRSDTQRVRNLTELAAFTIVSWITKAESERSAEAARNSAAVAELTALICDSESPEAACESLADRLRQHLHADDLFIGLAEPGDSVVRLVGRSHVRPGVSTDVAVAEAALAETLFRESASVWPEEKISGRHASVALARLTESCGAERTAGVPIHDGNGEVIAVIAATFRDFRTASEAETAPSAPDAAADRAVRFLLAAAPSFSAALGNVQKGTRGLSDLLRERWSRILRGRAVAVVAAVAAALTGICCIPMTHSVDADVTLQPVHRRFVASPFAGRLESCRVRPGDVVQKDAVLAMMDAEETRLELASVTADRNKAVRERDAYLAEHETVKAQIAGFEAERLAHREQLLRDRMQHLEIRSPVAGIVIEGDHRRSEGVPLETGESLFEIAPLSEMLAEIEVPEDDIPYVRPGQSVHVRLSAYGDVSRDAEITRVHPKAELRDDRNVFIAEARLGNTALSMRPGMQGEAEIESQTRMLGWILFHKPVRAFRSWTGW